MHLPEAVPGEAAGITIDRDVRRARLGL